MYDIYNHNAFDYFELRAATWDHWMDITMKHLKNLLRQVEA